MRRHHVGIGIVVFCGTTMLARAIRSLCLIIGPPWLTINGVPP